MRKILVVSKFIAPTQAVASIRWTKLMKYLYRMGEYEIAVLTDEKKYDGVGGNTFHRDRILEKEMTVFSQYHVIPDSMALRKYYSLKSRYSDYAMPATVPPEVSVKRQTVYEIMHDCKDWMQYRQAVAYIKAHPEILECDILITSYGPLWTHLVGEWIKKRKSEICWIADYRDPYFSEVTPTLVKLWRQNFAKHHTSSASLVTTVSKELLPMLRIPKQQDTMVLTNGFDPEEALMPQKSERFSLLYTGTMYNEGTHKYDLTPIFEVLKQLIDCGEIDAADISLEYAGGQGGLFYSQAESCGLGDKVKDYGILEREDAALLRQKAAVLLLCTWNTTEERGILTGKLFEYMLSQKPILATCTGDVPNCEIKEILHNGRLGFCYEICKPININGLTNQIRNAYQQWKQQGVPFFQPNEAYVAQFSHPVLAERLHQYIISL